MADFLSDLFQGVTGQKATPQQNIINTQDAMNQGYSTLNSLTPQMIDYNKKLNNAFTDQQLSTENKIYGPAANNLRQGTYKSILDQLNMGENLSPELQNDITRKLYESGAATGFGSSAAGRGNVILQTGLEGERRGQQRRAAALGATSALPASHFSPNEDTGFNEASGLAGDIRNVQAQKDDYENLKEDIRRKNFASLINTGGRIAGTVVGGVFGGPMGAQIGGQVGGSAFTGSGVAGVNQGQPQGGGGMGGMFSSLFSSFGKGGGAADYAGPDTLGGGMGGAMLA